MERTFNWILQISYSIWHALRDHPEIFQLAAVVGLVSAIISTFLYVWFVVWWRRHPEAIRFEHEILDAIAKAFRLVGKLAWPFVFVTSFFVMFVYVVTVSTFEHVVPMTGPTYAENLKHLIENEWLTWPVVLLAGILYRLRGTRRFLYGILEVLIGIVAVWCGLHVNGPTLEVGTVLPKLEESGLLLTKILSLATGVYIIIRGLDNMAQKLPRRMYVIWDMFFPNGRKVEAPKLVVAQPPAQEPATPLH